MNSITAIIPSFRRHENIPILVKRLQNQTHPPERIIVWNDNPGGNQHMYLTTVPGAEVVNTDSNWWSNYGSYLIGYLTNTDYVAIIDDDMPPGPEWFEFCVDNQKKTPGLYGKYGVIMTSPKHYRHNEHMDADKGDGTFTEVDMVGNSYFIPKKAINCMLFENPPTFSHTCDLHLSYCAQKHGGYKCYIPRPLRDEQLPYYKPEELKFTKADRAMYNDPDHYTNRDGYVRWAVKNGWKLLRFR
jgi:hypothetical protein